MADAISPEERQMIDAARARFEAEGRAIVIRPGASGVLPLGDYAKVTGHLAYMPFLALARVRTAMLAGAITCEEIAARGGVCRKTAARYRRLVQQVEGIGA